MDEAQTQGKAEAEDILVMMTTAKADLWSIRDPAQPIGASPMQSMQRLMDFVDHAHLGIRQQDLTFKSPNALIHDATQYCQMRCGQCPDGIDDLLLQWAGLHPAATQHSRSAIGEGEGMQVT